VVPATAIEYNAVLYFISNGNNETAFGFFYTKAVDINLGFTPGNCLHPIIDRSLVCILNSTNALKLRYSRL
jgi:hypothetical protein